MVHIFLNVSKSHILAKTTSKLNQLFIWDDAFTYQELQTNLLLQVDGQYNSFAGHALDKEKEQIKEKEWKKNMID